MDSVTIRRAERVAAWSAIVAIVGGVGFALAYVRNAGAQWQGLSLVIGFAALALFLIVYGKGLVLQQEATQERHDDEPEAQKLVLEDLDLNDARVPRRTMLHRLLGAAVGVLGIAVLFPLRTLAPARAAPTRSSDWRAGMRLVREDGTAVSAADLEIGSVLTVFPQGHTRSAWSQAMVIRVPEDQLKLPPERAGWAPQGLIAYSRVCTHAGCPVALYRQTAHQLFCPCHQSSFNVLDGANPIAGPAGKPLPQLPLRIKSNGEIVAMGDFSGPVGPERWSQIP